MVVEEKIGSRAEADHQQLHELEVELVAELRRQFAYRKFNRINTFKKSRIFKSNMSISIAQLKMS